MKTLKYQDCGCPVEFPCSGGHPTIHRNTEQEDIQNKITEGLPKLIKASREALRFITELRERNIKGDNRELPSDYLTARRLEIALKEMGLL
jgi:UDP:flavonoid glycosyltransferase YjiC (YdhE family)